jgi:hypothetical protein
MCCLVSPSLESWVRDNPVVTDHLVLTDVVRHVFGADLEPRQRGAWGLERLQPVSIDGGSALRVTYPAGSASPRSHRTDGSPLGGAQVYLPFRTGSREDAHLRYAVRFAAGFDFVRGGKLPGLYGGSMTSGGHIPDGTNGWSTRLMWRAAGAGEVYAYLPSSQTHGTSLGRGSWHWQPGRWHEVSERISLNSPGQPDGSIQLAVDGDDVLSVDDVLFRTDQRLAIDGVFFSSFFGGSDSSWASPRDQHVDFAGFQIGR